MKEIHVYTPRVHYQEVHKLFFPFHQANGRLMDLSKTITPSLCMWMNPHPAEHSSRLSLRSLQVERNLNVIEPRSF